MNLLKQWQSSTLSLLIYFVLVTPSVTTNETETTTTTTTTTNTTATKTPAKKCLPSEVQTVNKGCVDRETFLDSVLVRSWADENLDKAKEKAGVEGETVTCAPGEILTAYGCSAQKEPPRRDPSKRVVIAHSHMKGNQVIKPGHGYGDFDTVDTTNDSGHKQHKRRGGGRGKQSGAANGPRILGHNRPRHSVHMPGRLLRTGRHCRPNEVLAKNNRCIRKRGKTGKYTHHDHKYGLQRRHRHKGGRGGEDGIGKGEAMNSEESNA
ncbi:uncharacterized protein Dwil_GK11639 [Drosophila willistoni]|uniref:SCP domain-containing protein n=1 Tax=Drosophila willistoni TaxID=7260 RepID=B4N9S7_DROWI|nr:uncharacterized protein LOC6646933 [Drosophila willistoni]EDW80642.1 uncharacterized protein Dwil_GK11639 [Drosophila willistoni]